MKLLLPLLVASGTLFGCKRDISCEKCNADIPAKIIYSGPLTGDGCGWLVETDTSRYQADNLPGDYMQDGLLVQLGFGITGSIFTCGIMPVKLPVIHILAIRKK